MRILGIETVTRTGSLAVAEGGEIIARRTIDTKLEHASGLVSVLDDLLTSINVDISRIDTVAVDVGPGSFTGIRVGIASAKGLAGLDNKPLVGVCSLEVLCYEAIKEGDVKGYLVPFIDAKRGGIYSGWYKAEDEEVQVVKGPYLTTIKKLFDEMPSGSYIFGPDAGLIERDSVFPSAGTVAWLAEKKIKEGLEEKPVEPMYIYDVEYRKP